MMPLCPQGILLSMNNTQTYFPKRFKLIVLLIGIFIVISFVTRTILLFTDISEVDLGLLSLLRVYGVGLLYDLIASFYYVIPYVIYLIVVPNKIFNSKIHQLIVKLFIFMQMYILIFNGFSEWFFWEEFGKRFNFIAVDYLVYTHEVIHNILESYPIPLLLSVIFVISAILFFLLMKKTHLFKTVFDAHESFAQRLKTGLIWLLIPVVLFNLFNQQDLTKVSDNQYNNELAKNGFYSLFSAFRNNTLDYDEFYVSKDIDIVLENLEKETSLNNQKIKMINKEGEEQKYNVMLIMVESLSAEYMGIYGDKKNLTPHLDELSKKSLFFDHFYATGTRTVRGMEAVTLSIPPTPGRSIVKRPDNHGMFSAGFVFQEKGYESKFIYAGHGYFDNMNSFFSHNGFDIIDRTDLSDEEITFANVWGVCDEDLFARTMKEADKSYANDKPFFNFIMTTSNHRPYTYPEGKIDIPSHTGRDGGVKYTDFSIHKFLKDAEKKPWFDNTIFIVVADHNGGSAGKNALPVWRYKIPLIMYAPAILSPEVNSKISSQIDLMPTLFSMMNWSYKSKFYGEDILDKDFTQRAFIGNYQKLGYMKDNKLVVLSSDKTLAEYEIVKQTLRSVKYKEINPLEEDELNAITYYQSASYFYKKHLDRWDSD